MEYKKVIKKIIEMPTDNIYKRKMLSILERNIIMEKKLNMEEKKELLIEIKNEY